MSAEQTLFTDEPILTKRKRPTPTQADDAVRRRRGRERRNIRDAAFGGSNLKLLVWTLDDHIGEQSGWNLTFRMLAREMECDASTVYRLARRLKQLGVLSYTKVEGSERLYRFSIHHRNVSDFVDGDARQERRRKRQAAAQCKSVLHHATADSLHHARACCTVQKPVAPCKSSPHIGATIKPPPPPASWEEAEAKLISYGVGSFEAPIEAAKARGVPPEQVIAIVDHALAHPGAWGPGAVRRRVFTALPGQSPDDGWLESAKRKRAAERPKPVEAEDPSVAHERWIREREKKGLPTDRPAATPNGRRTFATLGASQP